MIAGKICVLSLLAMVIPLSVCVADNGAQAAAKQLGITQVELSQHHEVKVRVTPKDMCMFGDIDAIALETRWGGTTGKILLALEPISGEPGGASVAEISLADLADSGAAFTLTVPSQQTPKLFGLYICRDSSNANSCRGKEVTDYKAIFERYALDVAKDGEVSPKASETERMKPVADRIYFFKSVIIDQNSLRLSTKQTSDDRAAFMSQYLMSLSPDADYRADLDRDRAINKTIASLPLSLNGDVVEMSLPRITPDKCARRK